MCLKNIYHQDFNVEVCFLKKNIHYDIIKLSGKKQDKVQSEKQKLYKKKDQKFKIGKWTILDIFIFLLFCISHALLKWIIFMMKNCSSRFPFPLSLSLSPPLSLLFLGKVSSTRQGARNLEYNIQRMCVLVKSFSFSGPLFYYMEWGNRQARKCP